MGHFLIPGAVITVPLLFYPDDIGFRQLGQMEAGRLRLNARHIGQFARGMEASVQQRGQYSRPRRFANERSDNSDVRVGFHSHLSFAFHISMLVEMFPVYKVIRPKILYYGMPVILLNTLNEDGTVNISSMFLVLGSGRFDCLRNRSRFEGARECAAASRMCQARSCGSMSRGWLPIRDGTLSHLGQHASFCRRRDASGSRPCPRGNHCRRASHQPEAVESPHL